MPEARSTLDAAARFVRRVTPAPACGDEKPQPPQSSETSIAS
jgi:hypothetical protein